MLNSKKIFVCLCCDVEFCVYHDADEHFFCVEYCPFCSEPIETEQNYEVSEDE